MKNTLRSLERLLACQIAQIALKPIAEDYVERWKRRREQFMTYPDLDEIIEAARAARIPVLANGPLIDYIYQCGDDDRAPDPDRIVMAVVHGYAEDNFLAYGQTCRCPAKATLGGLQLSPGRERNSDWDYARGSGWDSGEDSRWD